LNSGVPAKTSQARIQQYNQWKQEKNPLSDKQETRVDKAVYDFENEAIVKDYNVMK
jgi:hypothetical protein